MTLIKIYLTLLILGLSAPSLGAKSLEWQKIELEKDIRVQYENVINSVIERDKFFINVEVKYNDPGMPRFKDLNEDQFKISDVKFDDSKGDYIAFSKIGLEVPVLGKSFQDNQRHLKELYRFNESYDLFKNLQSIDVKINVDESLPPATLDNLKKITDRINLSFLNFIPNVAIQKVNLSDGVPKIETKPKEAGYTFKDFLELLGKFGNAIGMILTVLLLGFVAFKLLKMYMDFVERMKALEKPAEEAQDEKEDEREQAFPDQHSVAEEVTADEEIKIGIERFERLMELNLQQAVFIIKKWVNQGDEESRLALTAIAQQFENEKLKSLYSDLEISARNLWNKFIGSHLEAPELLRANKIISEAVVKELVAGSPVDDLELLDIMLDMSSESVKQYITKNEKYGPMLSNLISPNILAEVMNELSPEEVDLVVSQSIDVDQSKLMSEITSFKEDLRVFCNKFKSNPFGQKIADIINDVSLEKELILYKYLLSQGSIADLRSAAKNCIPSNLIFALPASLTKFLMNDYPMKKKVELLAVYDEDQREEVLDMIADKGSNVREMIQMELNLILDDELQLQRLSRKVDHIKMDYVKFSRDALKNNEEHQEVIDDVVEQWLSDLGGHANEHSQVSHTA